MEKKYKARFELNYFIFDTLNSISGLLPHFMHDWVVNKARNIRRKNGKIQTQDLVEQKLKEGKYIRWTCGVCGVFIKEVKEWDTRFGSLGSECKNQHHNLLRIHDHGNLEFVGLVSLDLNNEEEKLFKNPKV